MNDGPTAEYARIYEEQQPRLVAYARSLTRNTWVAEDLVAEAHFRVWRRLSAGHEIDNVPAYLMTTVKHLATAAGSAARETPRDPQADERADASHAHVHGGDPAEQVSSTDLLVRVLEQLPERWVKALWLAEAEGLPLAAIGPQLGTKQGATAVLLHRAREGMRQAFLREQTGTPDDPACQVHWARMPAYVRGGATERQSERLLGHVDACDDCRARLAALMRANDRLPALVAPALLVFVLGGTGKFLLAAFGAGSAGAATAAGGHGAGLLHGIRHVAVGASKTQMAAAVGTAVAGAVAVCVLLGGTDTTEVPVAKGPVAEVPVSQAPVASEPRTGKPSKTPGDRGGSTAPAADGPISAVSPAALGGTGGGSVVVPVGDGGATPVPTAPVEPPPVTTEPTPTPTPTPTPPPTPAPPVTTKPEPEPTPTPPVVTEPKPDPTPTEPKPDPTPTDPTPTPPKGEEPTPEPSTPVKETPDPVTTPEPTTPSEPSTSPTPSEPSDPAGDQPCSDGGGSADGVGAVDGLH
ncbi:sigma-70 family RNA polymerase sigma factor [Streptomyces sp. NBC_01288]|uniref:sigma-70 family RNA polymerase sigma factor n=1 Tax=Streptomyces sp. NBC_01288 TaxID=2903814 RepID=UPI002E1037A0|nr:sigma-70 family RNA polymerase sigma factor [Streptomyces sp. NBC_01288]